MTPAYRSDMAQRYIDTQHQSTFSFSRQLPRPIRQNPRPFVPELVLDDIHMVDHNPRFPAQLAHLVLLRPRGRRVLWTTLFCRRFLRPVLFQLILQARVSFGTVKRGPNQTHLSINHAPLFKHLGLVVVVDPEPLKKDLVLIRRHGALRLSTAGHHIRQPT